MRIRSKKLIKAVDFEKKIECTCSFNNAKCEFTQGKILTFEGTNISFIEPHRVEIKVKDKNILLLYFDENNLFLYDRTMPITIEILNNILKSIKES